MMLQNDPIVIEVRQAGQALAEQVDGDLHRFFAYLHEAQQQYRERLVRLPLRPLQAVGAAAQRNQAHQAESGRGE